METADSNLSSTANIVAFLWLVSLVIVGFLAYFLGKAGTTQSQDQTAVFSPTPIPTTNALPTVPAADLETACDVTGPSQKKDFLVPYIMKEGDSFNSVAENELGDSTRVSELTKLNENELPITVGSTIYLPPKEIKESSGNLAQVSGKIVKKDNASWQLTYGGGTAGPGIVFPGFWFKDLPNTQNYKVGDCVKIFFDNGVKVYSVTKTSI